MQLPCGSQVSLLSVGESNFERIGSEEFSAPSFLQEKVQLPQTFDPGHSTPFSPTAAAATTLRLRLRVALFKVQTNQTAIPISHLQLPEPSPQPLSVFPPSLVRISTSNETHKYYKGYDDGDGNNDDEIGSTASPPPSSPPPLTGTATHYTGRGIPFLTPIRSSSPSPNHGKPLDLGSSSDLQGRSSSDCSRSAN